MAQKNATRVPRAPRAEGEQRGFSLTPDLIGKATDSKKIELQERRVSQKYIPLINAVMGMAVGQTIAVSVPKDSTIEKFRPAITMTLRKRLKDKINGRLSFGVTKDGKLAISLVKA